MKIMEQPIYALVRDEQVIGGPYKYKWVATGYCYPGEEVIEILPTDPRYKELKSRM